MQPSAATITGALAHADRRAVFAAVQLGAGTLEAVVAATGLDAAAAGKALGKLVEVGLVGTGGAAAGGLMVQAGVFEQAARTALARPASAEHDDAPAGARKVLQAFVADGRLHTIPTARTKRLVVLDWLAQAFEPGHRYSEQAVNMALGQRHADTAALRRYLVDEGFLDRADGMYWRVGGTVAASESSADSG